MNSLNLIKKNSVKLEDLHWDENLFKTIREDLLSNAGQHIPAKVWQDAGGGKKESINKLDAESLIFPWIGFGKNKISDESLAWYYQFIQDIDSLGLLHGYFDSIHEWKPGAEDLLIADLGTMIDLNLIAPYFADHTAESPPLHVIEVGGGYGRLAEAMFNTHHGPLKYVLIDAVPASLILAYEYLNQARPDLRIGSFYRGDSYDKMDNFDIYICPIWHFEKTSAKNFDLCINIQSMQEMNQNHVDFYLHWLNKLLKENGIAYLCNRRDHVFKGIWNYPDHWQRLMKIGTPRSWTRDFPTEIFRKNCRNFVHENNLVEALYQRDFQKKNAQTIAAAESRGYKIY